MPPPRISQTREWGSYYTPPFVVDPMLHGCLQPLRREGALQDGRSLRILDPACGDGAFLLKAFDILYEWYRNEASRHGPQERLCPATCLRIVRDHLFGVDVDAEAVHSLRSRLFERIAPEAPGREEARKVICAQVRWGDALTGADFESAGAWAGESRIEKDSQADSGLFRPTGDRSRALPVDWREAFPRVAGEGGFDVVVGNPPYRRELNAKPLFAALARSPLGLKWRQARMDLWYYFLHRGLDLLRPGGRLAFIVNSYWTASAGARKLIQRLQQETTIEEVVLLGDQPVFPDVAGRHLIFRLQKGRDDRHCRITDLSSADLSRNGSRNGRGRVREALVPQQADCTGAAFCDLGSSHAIDSYHVPCRDLFQHGQLSFDRPDPLLCLLSSRQTLGEFYEVRQGMAENPPCITPRLGREFGRRYRPGEGVFVLAAEEVESLGLSATERAYLRPYYRAAAVQRYRLPDEPAHFVLYLTRNTAPVLDDSSRLYAHLDRFRPLLERRRETRNGRIAWWQLHWPREERLFTEPRILCAQMGRRPQFVWVERPAFVGFSINLVVAASDDGFSLATLTAILNSALARRWFSKYAKRRGVKLEINGSLLKRFPLPFRDVDLEQQIEHWSVRRHCMPLSANEDDRPHIHVPDIEEVERTIDALVWRLYGVEERDSRGAS